MLPPGNYHRGRNRPDSTPIRPATRVYSEKSRFYESRRRVNPDNKSDRREVGAPVACARWAGLGLGLGRMALGICLVVDDLSGGLWICVVIWRGETRVVG